MLGSWATALFWKAVPTSAHKNIRRLRIISFKSKPLIELSRFLLLKSRAPLVCSRKSRRKFLIKITSPKNQQCCFDIRTRGFPNSFSDVRDAIEIEMLIGTFFLLLLPSWKARKKISRSRSVSFNKFSIWMFNEWKIKWNGKYFSHFSVFGEFLHVRNKFKRRTFSNFRAIVVWKFFLWKVFRFVDCKNHQRRGAEMHWDNFPQIHYLSETENEVLMI